jgi:NAD(P)-dependent dehydrogenase (short-subunit alcohol dehydrogenase family)
VKTALIAGGTSGIGRSIAMALLETNYEVLLIGKNQSKGVALEAKFNANHPGRVQFIQLDLSEIKAVRSFAEQFAQKHSKLHLLANVAGVMESKRQITNEGFEKTFAVGYLSAFVLSTQLAPLLEKAPNGRIANVAGVESFIFKARLDFDDLTFSRDYGSFKVAITTVHAKTVLTQLLSEKYASAKIDINAFHPGAVRSDLMKNMPWLTRQMFKIPSLFMTKTSKTGIRVSIASDLQGTSEKYITDKKTVDLNFEKSYQDQLWKETEKMLAGI